MSETYPGRAPLDQRLLQVRANNLHPDPDNPRTELGDLTELAASLQAVGMLQPIIARRAGTRLVVVAGHRRLAAAQLAGWDTVPVLVRPDMRPDDILAAMLVENGQRRDLDPIEEARALARLMRLHGLRSHAALAAKVGRTQGHVSARLALLALSAAEQDELRTGQAKIVEATARARLHAGKVRDRKPTAYFGAEHELAAQAKARCLRLKHLRGLTLSGGVACGDCWTSVIRADERAAIHAHSATLGRCRICDTPTPAAVSA